MYNSKQPSLLKKGKMLKSVFEIHEIKRHSCCLKMSEASQLEQTSAREEYVRTLPKVEEKDSQLELLDAALIPMMATTLRNFATQLEQHPEQNKQKAFELIQILLSTSGEHQLTNCEMKYFTLGWYVYNMLQRKKET